MKKLSLFLLSLFLCSVSVPILAEDVDLVPAMVVQMMDGSKQVVQLDYTAVTDFRKMGNYYSRGNREHRTDGWNKWRLGGKSPRSEQKEILE